MSDLLAFIGGGNMARSLISGLIAAGTDPASIRASDPVAAQRAAVEHLGVTSFDDNNRAVADAALVVLAVKPQAMAAVVAALELPTRPLVISIAAGVPVHALQRWLPDGTPIVRCMPNTPALLGAGITGMYAPDGVGASHRAAAEAVLGAAGKTLWVLEEAQLDAVTAVSGSGPAYFFYLMEAMIEAGVSLGLDRESARLLTLETAYGAARMAREGADAPDRLRTNVTSPGGTTERALSILDAAGARQTVQSAVAGAAQRARELAEEFGRP
ncbi:MAG: pyrroline-5-carboxylate reductase [Pseudomonadales bacterium]